MTVTMTNPMARTARRCKLTPLESKVARVMFADNGGRMMTLAECAAKVGAQKGWVYRAVHALCAKIARD